MGHGKETPRQKMIGMMYLVLTAMLALNVSKDILNAFVLVDNGLAKTLANFVEKNTTAYAIFDMEYSKTPDKVRLFRDNAYSVKQMADQLAYDIQEYKVDIVKYCDGGDKAKALYPMEMVVGSERKSTFGINAKDINAKDNYDKPSEIMMLKGKGLELRQKIEAYREHLISLTNDESVQNAIRESLKTDDMPDKNNQIKSWEFTFFDGVPLVAVVALMTKLQSDVRNAEADIINYLLARIGATDTKVNKMEAIVQAESNYILKGNEFKARILLAAYDSLQKPQILIGPLRKNAFGVYEMVGDGKVLPYDEQGRAIYKASATSVGNFTLSGLLNMVGPDGMVSYPFSSEYQVGESTTVISPDKMNVLYLGLDNPISISMSGVPGEKIQARMSNGTITKQGSGWIAKPGTTGTTTIYASGTVDGKPVNGEPAVFRVKMVPTPIAKIGGKSGGTIERNEFRAQLGILAEMEDFLFDLRYQVTQFTMTAVTRDGDRALDSKSASFTAEQKALIETLNRGTTVIFSNIKARGPDGTKNLVDITLRIN